MAWEWLDNVIGLDGQPADLIGININWDNILNIRNNGGTGVSSDTGISIINGVESPFFFSGGQDRTYTTEWGLTIKWRDRYVSYPGGFDFISNILQPGSSSSYYGYGRTGLLEKGTFRMMVNHELEELDVVIVSAFQNPGWYTLAAFSGVYQNHDYRKVFYDFVMGHIQPEYQWQSVPAISGKMGILSLTTAEDSYHTGDTVSNIPLSDVAISEPSRMQNLAGGLPTGQSVDLYYTGSVDHMHVTNQGVRWQIDLILAGQTVYTTTALRISRYLGFIIDDDNEVAKLVWYVPHTEADILVGYDEVPAAATDTEMHDIWRFIQSHDNTDDDPEINEPDDGTPDDYQSDIAITGLVKPASGAYDTGFTSQYRVSDTQLKNLARYLWTNNFWENVGKFFSDPREIIIGLTLMPVVPDTGTAKEIKAGGISTGIYGLPLTDQYKLDTFGYASIKKEKGNFLDYSPYTKVTAHLPFVGEHSLDVNDVMGKDLQLKYIFDFLTGSCVAEIDVNGKPRYFFGGASGIQIPTSSQDFTSLYSSIISAGASLGAVLSTVATGGLTAPLAIGTAGNMLANAMNASPTVQFSSGSGSVNGMIGCKTAFLVIEKPIEKVAGDQNKFIGKPSFIRRKLKSCTGYTKCMEVHLDNVPCTGHERSELSRLLTNGVRIATNGSSTPSYTPSAQDMHGIILMKMWSDIDVIGKTWSDAVEVEGKLMFDQNIETPKFILNGNYSAYNYAYVPEFGRFYFIMSQSIKTGNMTEIDMQVDVLQSFKDELVGENADVDAVIERQQSLNNAYFSDSMYWTQVNKEVKTVPFLTAGGDELVFSIPEDNFILTIAGGD